MKIEINDASLPPGITEALWEEINQRMIELTSAWCTLPGGNQIFMHSSNELREGVYFTLWISQEKKK